MNHPAFDPNPSRRTLAGFAAILFVGFGILAGWARTSGRPVSFVVGLSACGVALALLALTPRIGPRMYVVWMRLGLAIGRVTQPIVLAIVYFGVFLPIGLVRRWGGRDPLRRELRPRQRSYWEPTETSKSPTDYFRPY